MTVQDIVEVAANIPSSSTNNTTAPGDKDTAHGSAAVPGAPILGADSFRVGRAPKRSAASYYQGFVGKKPGKGVVAYRLPQLMPTPTPRQQATPPAPPPPPPIVPVPPPPKEPREKPSWGAGMGVQPASARRAGLVGGAVVGRGDNKEEESKDKGKGKGGGSDFKSGQVTVVSPRDVTALKREEEARGGRPSWGAGTGIQPKKEEQRQYNKLVPHLPLPLPAAEEVGKARGGGGGGGGGGKGGGGG